MPFNQQHICQGLCAKLLRHTWEKFSLIFDVFRSLPTSEITEGESTAAPTLRPADRAGLRAGTAGHGEGAPGAARRRC